MSVIDEVKARTDIVELVGETVKLRKSGNSYVGFCPFHDNKRTPAFVVWPESGSWRCFGACAEGGSVFDYVMKRDNVDFGESLRALAARAGVELHERGPDEIEQEESDERLRQLVQQAITYYQHLLRNAEAADRARRQLAERGISQQTIEDFELGYALDEWNATQAYFHGKGYNDDDLLAAGLLVRADTGRTYDRFRNRIIIPIRDDRGRAAGFGARVVNPDDVPKYLNSPQSELFNKSLLLYGFDRARKPIRESDTAVIVEGYMDVIAAHQAGYANVVASMGTALTEAQLRLIKRVAHRLVLALDADAAGLKATLRGLETARKSAGSELVPTFDPRGLLRTEGRLKLDIRVAVLPAGLDPDDVIHQQDAEAWPNLIANAQPVAEYVMQALSAGRDLGDPKVAAEIAREVMSVIGEVDDAVEQGIYRQKLARLLGIDERDLLQWQASPRPRKHTPRPVSPRMPPGDISAVQEQSPTITTDVPALELYCLGVLVRFPDLLSKVDRTMREAELAPLDGEDFTQVELRLIFAVLRTALHQDQAPPVEYLRATLDESLHQLMTEIEYIATDFSGDDPRHVANLEYNIFLIRKWGIENWLRQMRMQQAQAHESGDSRLANLFQKEIVVNTRALHKVSLALGNDAHSKTKSNTQTEKLIHLG